MTDDGKRKVGDMPDLPSVEDITEEELESRRQEINKTKATLKESGENIGHVKELVSQTGHKAGMTVYNAGSYEVGGDAKSVIQAFKHNVSGNNLAVVKSFPVQTTDSSIEGVTYSLIEVQSTLDEMQQRLEERYNKRTGLPALVGAMGQGFNKYVLGKVTQRRDLTDLTIDCEHGCRGLYDNLMMLIGESGEFQSLVEDSLVGAIRAYYGAVETIKKTGGKIIEKTDEYNASVAKLTGLDEFKNTDELCEAEVKAALAEGEVLRQQGSYERAESKQVNLFNKKQMQREIRNLMVVQSQDLLAVADTVDYLVDFMVENGPVLRYMDKSNRVAGQILEQVDAAKTTILRTFATIYNDARKVNQTIGADVALPQEFVRAFSGYQSLLQNPKTSRVLEAAAEVVERSNPQIEYKTDREDPGAAAMSAK